MVATRVRAARRRYRLRSGNRMDQILTTRPARLKAAGDRISKCVGLSEKSRTLSGKPFLDGCASARRHNTRRQRAIPISSWINGDSRGETWVIQLQLAAGYGCHAIKCSIGAAATV